jgi:hypothetical protein
MFGGGVGGFGGSCVSVSIGPGAVGFAGAATAGVGFTLAGRALLDGFLFITVFEFFVFLCTSIDMIELKAHYHNK